MNNGKEYLAFRLWTHFQLLKTLDQEADRALTKLIELGIEKFFASEPSVEERSLIKILIPQISEQVAATA